MNDRIIAASWIGTGLFALTAVGDVVTADLKVPAFVVAMAMFVVGTGVFLAALVIAAGRSRDKEIGMGGLFFLQGSAPGDVQRHLLGSLAVEVVVAFATAGAKPYTSLAFGILAPVYGLGLAGLWAAKRGEFGPRAPRPRRV
ncbi:MAG TPA: hypothetical protein VFB78_02035 [Acidimicrobiales bacterium]|nr:hypothetical protein [Acidimicrobiales bacterium]